MNEQRRHARGRATVSLAAADGESLNRPYFGNEVWYTISTFRTEEAHPMAHEVRQIDITNNPDMLRVAKEVRESRGARVVLRADGEALAEIKPLGKRSRLPRGKRTSPDDPIWNIIS